MLIDLFDIFDIWFVDLFMLEVVLVYLYIKLNCGIV